MKQRIIDLAGKLKISDIGFCSTEEYNRQSGGGETASFVKGGQCRTPEQILPGAKSIIVCAFGYYTGGEKGNISRYARGADYHMVTAEKMKHITRLLESEGYSAAAFADTGELNERLLARLAGIAFVGRNRMAINPRLGSYFFIGYILTDCLLEADSPCTDSCAGCNRCVEACPLGALSDGFDEEKCLSYITQKKGSLSETEERAITEANTIWGCDICQEVCPHNANPAVTEIEEFKRDLIINLHIDETLSNKAFMRIYGGRAFAWRGKGVLLRNQKIVEKLKKIKKRT